MSIGLKRGTVKLSAYSADWAVEYERERALLLKRAGHCIARIEHIGSTSVEGLMAKPIIDIGIEVASIEQLTMLVSVLPAAEYEYFGERTIPGDYFIAKGSEALRTHYFHISLAETQRLDKYVLFRNALRHNPQLAREYQDLKQSLSAEYQNDRYAYTTQKASFIEKVLNSA